MKIVMMTIVETRNPHLTVRGNPLRIKMKYATIIPSSKQLDNTLNTCALIPPPPRHFPIPLPKTTVSRMAVEPPPRHHESVEEQEGSLLASGCGDGKTLGGHSEGRRGASRRLPSTGLDRCVDACGNVYNPAHNVMGGFDASIYFFLVRLN